MRIHLLAYMYLLVVSCQATSAGQVTIRSVAQHVDSVGGLTRLSDQTLLVVGSKAPADQGYICDTDHCTGQTNRREIKHTETLAQRVIAIFSNDNIGREFQYV